MENSCPLQIVTKSELVLRDKEIYQNCLKKGLRRQHFPFHAHNDLQKFLSPGCLPLEEARADRKVREANSRFWRPC